MKFVFVREDTSAGESGYGAGELTFVRTLRSGTYERKGRALSAGAALRLPITIPGLPGCVFPTHNSKFKFRLYP